MAKIILDTLLTDGTNKQEFVDSFNSETEAELKNILKKIPNMIVMKVEEDFIDNFRSHSSVISANEPIETFEASTPPTAISMTKRFTSSTSHVDSPGENNSGVQFIYDSNQIYEGSSVGRQDTKFATSSSHTYKSRWTGKNVDIVTFETLGAAANLPSRNVGVHDSHPDFDDLENSGTSRVIPMNWTDLDSPANNQVTPNNVFSNHGMKVLSVAAGTICGFAKKANLRAVYVGNPDDIIEGFNAIIDYHDNKPNNSDTGVPDPTIMIVEFQILMDRRLAIPIDYVSRINKSDGTTVNRSGSSWGSDFSEFVNEGIIPFQVEDPRDRNYYWCVVLPAANTDGQFVFAGVRTALTAAVNAGIVVMCAAGNNGGVYEKYNKRTDTSIEIDASTPYDVILLNGPSFNSENSVSSVTTWYPLWACGPHGHENCIDVGAGFISEDYPGIDSYSNRGPGCDIFGLGTGTWCSAPPGGGYLIGSHHWNIFSGTSGATPTVVGKAACLMEEYFWYNGSWPTPAQVKTILLSKASNKLRGFKSFTGSYDWTNVPAAGSSSSNFGNTIMPNTPYRNILKIGLRTPNQVGINFTELARSPQLRAYFDPQDQDDHPFNHRIKHNGKRRNSGSMYPRVNSAVGRHNMDLPDFT
jgi:hypothetical protein